MDMRTLAAEYLAACEFGKRLSAEHGSRPTASICGSTSSSPGARRAAVSCCRGISRI